MLLCGRVLAQHAWGSRFNPRGKGERERKPWTESDCNLAEEGLGKKSLVPPVTYRHDKTAQVPFSVILLNLNTVEHFPKALLGPDVW